MLLSRRHRIKDEENTGTIMKLFKIDTVKEALTAYSYNSKKNKQSQRDKFQLGFKDCNDETIQIIHGVETWNPSHEHVE
jgi:hypothetical protein